MDNSTAVNPQLIRWAITRSGVAHEELLKAFPKLDAWQRGERQPTFRQLELFAQKTMTPLGYLFLAVPPDEQLPIPDFRTVGDVPIGRPSPNLIATIHCMLRRQAWMRESLMEQELGAGGVAVRARG